MFQYLCVAVVYNGYLLFCILVMFDVMTHLLCCILGYLIYWIVCMLHFLYVNFGGSPAGEADKIGKKIKKFLCSSIIFIG
jgi:hypothetical protein